MQRKRRALPCGAARCCSVLCCAEFTISHIPGTYEVSQVPVCTYVCTCDPHVFALFFIDCPLPCFFLVFSLARIHTRVGVLRACRILLSLLTSCLGVQPPSSLHEPGLCGRRENCHFPPSRFYSWKPFLGTNLLEVTIGRDFWTPKGLKPKTVVNRLGPPNPSLYYFQVLLSPKRVPAAKASKWVHN